MKLEQMIWFGILFLAASSMFGANVANAKEESVSMLIDADQLQMKLGDKTLRVIDTRSQENYEKGHVPGAVRVDVADWKSLVASPNGLRDTKEWAKKIGELGLAEDSHVVVYGDKLSNTARVWWLLKYVGVSKASILDGGWQYWLETGKATETNTSTMSATLFKPNFQKDRLEEIDSLKQSLESVTVIDTRSSEEFAAGHIGAATRIEWKELVADDGRFKTKTELQRLFRENNVLPAHTTVCY